MKNFLFCVLFFSCSILFAREQPTLKAQPEILFEYSKLKSSHEQLAKQVDFNKAVLLINKGSYKEAIEILKKTAKEHKVPSFLNIGISYYKLGSNHNAKLYLDEIFKNEDIVQYDIFSYLSSCYYLYKITNDEKYLDKLSKIAKKQKDLSDHATMLVIDTQIILKDYKGALGMLLKLQNPDNFKIALLYMKLQDMQNCGLYLGKAKETTHEKEMLDKVIWVTLYLDLKTNNITKFEEDMKALNKARRGFAAHTDLPMKIFFNKRKYTSAEYFNKITKFDFERQVDFLFYFSPFVFSDNEEIFYDSAQGFINTNPNNLQALNKMVVYNEKLLAISKKDPIVRVWELQKMLKEDTKSYVYYNLGLSYAQIDDFFKAHTYFKKAFKLNPGNKLYAALTLISAKRANITLKDSDYIVNLLKNNRGMYNYFGQQLYKFFIDPGFKIIMKNDDVKFKNTMYFKALDFLTKMDKSGLNKDSQLLKEYQKDPFVYLMNFTAKDKKESMLQYISRMQDKMPLKVNNNFLDGPLIVTKYYFDMLKAVGIFHKADLNILGSNSPSYLRTRAYRQLHNGYAADAIAILDYLQNKYKLEDKHTMYLMVAALLEAKRDNDASANIMLIKGLLDDTNADFLIGVQLLNELKTTSIMDYFKSGYTDSLIDFRLENVDELLESL